MKRYNLYLPGLIFLLILPLNSIAAKDTLSPPSLQQLVSEALTSNAELQAAKARWDMFSHKVAPARSLNDPRLSFGLLNYPVNSLASDETPMTGNDLRLEQSFPFPGKLALKGQIAEQQAAWYEAAYLDKRTEVAYRVKDSWYLLYSLERALELVRSNRDAVEQLLRLSETRYAVGKGLQQDVLRAQLQHSQLMDREFALVQERAVVLARLTALLNREIPVEFSSASRVPEDLILPDLTGASSTMERKRPLFKAYRALIEQYRVQKGLAKKDFYPDFGVWAGYRFRDDNLPDGGEDFVSAGFSVNLPIYRAKRHAQIADAEAGLTMARQQYQQLYSQTTAALHDSYAQLVRTRDRVRLFETGVVPQAQQTFNAALTAYQVGKLSFKELIDSQLALYDYQIDYHRALGDFYRIRARFDQLAGAGTTDPDPTAEDRK